jgi:hypothetical protein
VIYILIVIVQFPVKDFIFGTFEHAHMLRLACSVQTEEPAAYRVYVIVSSHKFSLPFRLEERARNNNEEIEARASGL